MANPVIGNSLFAIVLALMHVPPMFALLWAQRRLRGRLAMTEVSAPSIEPLLTSLPASLPAAASVFAPPSRG